MKIFKRYLTIMKQKKFLLLHSWLFFFFIFSLYLHGIAKAENECLTCHSEYNQPAKSIHSIVKTGCDICHKPVEGKNHPVDKKSIQLVQAMPGLCYTCHKEAGFKGPVVHAFLAGGKCTACHNAHRSENEKLLVSKPPDLCYMCHDSKKFTKKNVHKVLSAIGCTGCHLPHVSKEPALLPKPVFEVCVACHKEQGSGRHIIALPGRKVHPLKGAKDLSTIRMIKVPHPTKPGVEIEVPDPDTPGKEMTCVSCHDPHSSDYPMLKLESNLCQRCHTKY
jgi:predicted CXXCH cytochrome family protein